MFDERVGARQLRRSRHLCVGGVQFAVADVVRYGACEQVCVLQNDSQAPAQIRLFDLVDIDAVVADLAVRNVIKAVDEVCDGRFARAGGSHKSDLLAGPGIQADVVQNDLGVVVTEIHVVEHHFALQPAVGGAAVGPVVMLPGPDTRAPAAFFQTAVRGLFRIHQLHIAFVGFRRLIHQAEYALRACQRHDDGVELLRYL